MSDIIEIPIIAEDLEGQEDWLSGNYNPGKRCMLDRALDRTFGEGKYDMLTEYATPKLGFLKELHYILFDANTIARRADFDDGKPVEPFVARGRLVDAPWNKRF